MSKHQVDLEEKLTDMQKTDLIHCFITFRNECPV